MKTLLLLSLLAVAAPVAADTPSTTIEQRLVKCIFEKDKSILIRIRDAGSEQEFVDNFKAGVALCDYPEQEYSMGGFFTALNAMVGPPEYKD
jgi:hypothetical protein